VSTFVDVVTTLLALAAVYAGALGLDRLLRKILPAEESEQPIPLADVDPIKPTGTGWPSAAMVSAAACRRPSRRYLQERAWATYRSAVRPCCESCGAPPECCSTNCGGELYGLDDEIIEVADE
jgi:hypothetical protein